MKQSEMSALLGRPLTSIEDTNFKTYLNIATQELEELLCITLCNGDDGTRTFDADEGYRTVFADIFTEVTEVKVDGDVVDPEDYSPRQWDKRNASWYNSIVFDTKFREESEVEITADWGFSSVPNDLKSLLAGLFSQVTSKNSASLVTSKQVEDFRIAFRADTTAVGQLLMDNATTVRKYSMCDIRPIRSGRVYCGYRLRYLH